MKLGVKVYIQQGEMVNESYMSLLLYLITWKVIVLYYTKNIQEGLYPLLNLQFNVYCRPSCKEDHFHILDKFILI